MKHKFFITVIAGLFLGQTVSAQSVFSPSVNGMRSSYQSRRAASADAQNERIGIVVTCSVEASAAAIANQMIEMGAVIRVLMANQIVADLPMSQLDAAAAIEGVLLIDKPSEGRQCTDTARKVSHVDEVHAGKMTGEKDLPQAYTGKGVIIGLIDGGFDYTHPMFKDANGNLRIKGVYQPKAVDDKHKGQPGNFSLENIAVIDEKGNSTTLNLSGSFYTNPDVILDTTLVKDITGSHGTHCASIAAGSKVNYAGNFCSKYDNSGLLGGMAPEADLILAETPDSEEEKKVVTSPLENLMSYNGYQALWALKRYAEEQKKPLVISWSHNSQDGAHDGTSTMARYIGNYCKQGNILALCAGNDGANNLFIERTIGQGKDLKVWCKSGNSNSDSFFSIRTDKEIKVDLAIVDKNHVVKYTCGLPLTSKSGDVAYKKAFKCTVTSSLDFESANSKKITYNDEYYKDICNKLANYLVGGTLSLTVNAGAGLNSKNETYNYVEITLRLQSAILQPEDNPFENYYPMLIISSPESEVQLRGWGDTSGLMATSMEQPEVFTPGNSSYSIGDWNTSGEPVTIGAYATDINMISIVEGKKVLTPSDGEEVGRYGSFSSYGTDLSDSPHSYPDVSAPGVAIYAAYNSFDATPQDITAEYSNQYKGQTKPRSYPYSTDSGTSMSTPAAAGIIALWLQAAKDKGKTLTNTDIKDIIKNTSTTDAFTKANPERYGAGKIDAYKGLLYVLDVATAIPELPTRHIGATLNGHTLHIQGNPDVRVTIYNLSGQLVLDTQAQSGIVELPSLPAGVYAVKIGTQGSTLIRL